jgi:hypothetical protein
MLLSSVLSKRNTYFINRSKEKGSHWFSSLPGRRYYITGSLVLQDDLIYEYPLGSICQDSLSLHVYFIPSFKSQ